ncbi:MAG: lipopolysaccharide heptosyltransferase II [Candidatus Omnitrophica bacterium]|nr:lipopolysaccharide heptosyltransferase II [Candidatus Omnitrophota bacterium]
MKPIHLKSIHKILVTRTDRIGDVILSTPICKVLKEVFPKASISMLVLPATYEIIEGNPYVENIIIYDKRGKHKCFWKTVQFALHLRKEKIDIAIHLHPTNRVHMISFFAGIPIRIGYKKKCHFLLTHSIEEKKAAGAKHEAEYNFDLVKLLGIEPPREIKPLFFIDQKDEKALDIVLNTLPVALSSFVVLFPGASCRSKMWPPERFAQLADILNKKYKKQIVIVGSENDKKTVEEVMHYMKETAVNLTGKVSLKMLGVLFKRSNLLISNDSGPVHIAASLNVPVISLFGRSDRGLSPTRWRPLGPRSLFMHKDVGCASCSAHNCKKGFLCLRAISVDDVLSVIKKHFSYLLS